MTLEIDSKEKLFVLIEGLNKEMESLKYKRSHSGNMQKYDYYDNYIKVNECLILQCKNDIKQPQ